MAQVYFNAARLGQQFLVDAKGKAALLFTLIRFRGGVQSQRQTRAATAAGGQINADDAFFLAREIAFKFLAGAFGQFQHASSIGYAVKGFRDMREERMPQDQGALTALRTESSERNETGCGGSRSLPAAPPLTTQAKHEKERENRRPAFLNCRRSRWSRNRRRCRLPERPGALWVPPQSPYRSDQS